MNATKQKHLDELACYFEELSIFYPSYCIAIFTATESMRNAGNEVLRQFSMLLQQQFKRAEIAQINAEEFERNVPSFWYRANTYTSAGVRKHHFVLPISKEALKGNYSFKSIRSLLEDMWAHANSIDAKSVRKRNQLSFHEQHWYNITEECLSDYKDLYFAYNQAKYIAEINAQGEFYYNDPRVGHKL